MESKQLSIIIPCYNEERNIRLGALEAVASYLAKKKFSYEVIIIDDGSVDESRLLIKKFISHHPKFRLIHKKHQGKAAAVIAGLLAAKNKYVFFTDLDQATPINQIEVILPWFDKGYDVVIGSRNRKRKGAPLLRIAMARGFMIIRNLVLNLGIKDTQCGFKAFKKEVLTDVIPRLQVYNLERGAQGSTVTAGFDVEFLYVAKLLGYKIAEVPVEWHYQETRHISPFKDSWEGLIGLLKIRLNSMKGLYKEV